MQNGQLEGELKRLHNEAWDWALSCCSWDPHLAEDVLQEAYSRVFGGKTHWEGNSSVRTWFWGVIRLVALEQGRDRRRSDRISHGAKGGGLSPTSPPSPDETTEERERSAQLQVSLQELPERQRAVLELVFFQDLTLAEAAEVMGISPGTASTHYKRGKRRLRERLSKLWEDK